MCFRLCWLLRLVRFDHGEGKNVTQASDMQERKNKTLAFLLIVLMLITVGVYWIRLKDRNPVVDKNIFQVADYKNIDRVTLESGTGKIELSFNGSRWRINDRYDADRNLITVLFATLKEAVPKRPVAPSLQDSVNTILKKNGVTVSLFNGHNMQRQFLSGGDPLKGRTYFKDRARDETYLVNIPGYRVYVAGILELTENQWRDKHVFAFNWRNFQSLEVSFPGKPEDNFKVAPQNNMFGIEGIKTDTTKLGSYMDHVLSLTVNEYMEPGKYTDSLMNASPYITLIVTDIAKKQYALKLFRETLSQVPGLFQENQGVIFNRLKIQPLMRPKSYFQVQ